MSANRSTQPPTPMLQALVNEYVPTWHAARECGLSKSQWIEGCLDDIYDWGHMLAPDEVAQVRNALRSAT